MLALSVHCELLHAFIIVTVDQQTKGQLENAGYI